MKKIISLAASAAIMLAAHHAYADAGYQPYYYAYDNSQARVAYPEAKSAPVVTPVPAQAPTLQPVAEPIITMEPAVTVSVPAGNTAEPLIITSDPVVPPTQVATAVTTTSNVAAAPLSDTARFKSFQAVPPYNYTTPAAKSEEVDTPASVRARYNYWSKDAILNTRSGIDMALQVSNYHYREPSLDVSLAGEKGGVNLTGTGKFWGDNFFTTDLRFAVGTVDYSGSGRKSGNLDYLFDVRGLVGHDFANKWYGFSPYVGLGFRHLNNDIRGTTSTGAVGYRRHNNLYYVPMGATQRFRLSHEDRITLNGEYDYVFLGTQKSYLTDTGLALPDVENPQRTGNGMRASLMWDTPYWSVGPFANYWVIAESESNTTGNCAPCTEPHNSTIEVGLQVKFHAFDF